MSESGYSYVRFSDPSQSAGDSLRRQTEDTAAWCQRNGVHLDTSLNLRDLGVSAFRGRHRRDDKHALAQFLKLAERGRVPKGSFLVIENLDRLSREDERTALRLWMDILDAGINIVQLHPETIFRHEKSDLMDVMRAIIELSRGHSESARKSERVGAAWGQRRVKARQRNGLLTRRLPAWVREEDDHLLLIPARADVVRRIFDMAGAGCGLYVIMRTLTAEKVPAFGPSGRWSVSYLDLILKDRRALGEYQPRLRKGKGRGEPDGEPIPDYFPRVVTDEAWERARAGAKERYRRRGRLAAVVNVFAGILKSARGGASYTVKKEMNAGNPYRILCSQAPRLSLGKADSFPLETFEKAIFGQLKEINAREILDGANGHDDVVLLEGRLGRVEKSLEALSADMDQNGESPGLLRRYRTKEAEHSRLAKELAEARRKAANPLSAAWGEAQGLLVEVLDKEQRLRLRSALRGIIDEIRILVVPRGRDRLAAVQIWFAGGERHRDYLILHRPPKANATTRTEGGWWCRSLATVTNAGTLDLRNQEHVKRLEKALLEVQL
jgi:DNA invertase Pin-like site-specific DNA recombinase